ncbi:esterase [Rugosimonospora africana]|uniref:Esterase n=1 Tax=Rugosimonospora africana TaxID=556532 RepID=A0A8J3VW54_9ACTN|nr:esterase [Rugosimonospora africana]
MRRFRRQYVLVTPPQLRLDPELAAISVMIPEFDLLDDLSEARRLEDELAAQGRNSLEGVAIEDVHLLRRGGGQLRVRSYRPSSIGTLPAILYIHGGAFMLGSVATEDERCEFYARDANCVVFALDYRLAPEHPFPAAFDDCNDVLDWLYREAGSLGIDPRRIAIGGNSAGGALAASTALHARAFDRPPLTHQLLVNPVLDCRSRTPSVTRFTDTPVWTRAHNLLMWERYLGPAASSVDYRASPALADDLTGLPSASFWIAEFDPLRDEDYEYAIRLMGAGVQVDLTQYAGTMHGFDGYRMTGVGRRAMHDQIRVLRRVFQR